MRAYDFEYNGRSLSEFGMIICNFGSNGMKTISLGSNITFHTISSMRGEKHEVTSSSYEECLNATIQICKNSCSDKSNEITPDEIREVMKWLNRKSFHKFKLLAAEYVDYYFEASFNVSKLEYDGAVYGLELEMVTNRPFALMEPIHIVLKNTESNGIKYISSQSDEEGYVYPEMKILIESDGDFVLHNALENRTMRISGCKSGEVISLHYPMISTSLSSHKIQNDFNWNFFRIANSFTERKNTLTISIPCTIEITYSPIVKLGI